MTGKEEEAAATEEMRKMTPEEMLKVSPSEYMGECERVSFVTKQDASCHVPVPILELEDDELTKNWIAEWQDSEIDMDCNPSW